MLRGRQVRIYVRNKARYNPETKERGFLFVDITDFAGTTIGDIKENVRRQTKNSLRIDALYLNNEPLANDRSVAHYNLEDGTILETTSNPFWVSCLYIKAAEVRQAQEGHPDDEEIQKWTQKSLPKKFTLIGLLLNSKNEYKCQPPHFPSLDDFVHYLEDLKKKGATMHPNYTQKDMRALQQEYDAEFVGRYPDPLAAFLDHYTVKLGYLDADDIVHCTLENRNFYPEQNQGPEQNHLPQVRAVPEVRDQGVAAPNKAGGRRRVERLCEDCEENAAEVYCVDCPGGIALCRPCSAVLHAGATRRRHTLQDIAQAPKTTKPYVPRAFLAPFAIVVAMYSAMTDGRLSLTENEIKEQAQSLTDTDLQDKQHGKYVGGFDCMENVLMMKGFVQKEAARVPTYALTETGQVLGEKLYTFYMAYYNFSQKYQLPKVANGFRSSVHGNRKLCLLIDENERDKERLLRFAAKKQISAQTRLLPAGDYIWILTPPMIDPQEVYTGRDYANEMVLPFVVERKSWEDLGNSTQTNRFRRQINSMLGSGIKNCFYLMEGTLAATKFNPTHHQQHQLKALIEKLTSEHGFYVNYTTSWMKSAQWLLWFTSLIIEGIQKGLFREAQISYTEYMSRVARQQGAEVKQASYRHAHKHAHQWSGQLFIDYIFRDSLKERPLLTGVREDLHTNDGDKHLLIIENLQHYNKKRQSTLNKCCDAVHTNPGQAKEIVEDKLGGFVHNLVHYDIPSYWQLSVQILLGVYVVRTESDQDRDRVRQRFLAGPQDPPPPPVAARVQNKTPKEPRQPRKRPAQTVSTNRQERSPPKQPKCAIPTSTVVSENTPSMPPADQFRRKAQIHTIDTLINPSGDTDFSDHVTHRDALIGQKEQHGNGQSKTSTHSVHPIIQPFSGRGFSLGRSSEENSIPLLNESEMLRDRLNMMVGLLGGMRDRDTDNEILSGTFERDDLDESDNALDDNEAVALDLADFIDSQNEDEILKEVMNKSIADTERPSNEEHMYQLALALSKQDTNTSRTKADNEDVLLNEAIERSKIDARNNNEDKLLKMALERSKLEASDSVTRNESSLKSVIERSKKETRNQGNKEVTVNCLKSADDIENKENVGVNVDINDDEAMLKYAIEMSLKTLVKEETVGKGLMDLPEEDQVKMALEMSLSETPIKCEPSEPTCMGDSDKLARLGNTSTDTPLKPDICRYTHSETEGIATPERVSRKAVKRKLVTNESEYCVSDKSAINCVSKRYMAQDVDLEKNVQVKKCSSELPRKDFNDDEQLTLAIERSTVEHTPCKKSRKSDDEDLRLALEISKAEQHLSHYHQVLSLKKEPDDSETSADTIAGEAKRQDEKTNRVSVDNERKDETGSKESNLGCYSHCSHTPGSVVGNSDVQKNTCAIDDHKGGKHDSEDDKESQIEDEDDLEDNIVPPTPEKSPHSSVSGTGAKKQLNSVFSAQRTPCISGNRTQIVTTAPNNSETNHNGCNSTGRIDDSAKNCAKERKKTTGVDIFRKVLRDTSDDSDTESEGESVENIFETDIDKDFPEDKTNILGATDSKSRNKTSPCSKSSNRNETGDIKKKTLDTQTHLSFSEKSLTSQKKNCEPFSVKQDMEAVEANDSFEDIPTYKKKYGKSLSENQDVGVESNDSFEDFEDLNDDDHDHDIDYQPSTQELKEMKEDKNDEESDESQEEFDDGEMLPVILRPRSKRYRELRAKYDNLLNGISVMSSNKRDIASLTKEKASYGKDRDLAIKLQEEMDQEFRRGTYESSDNEDEIMAKRLQAFYDQKRQGNIADKTDTVVEISDAVQKDSVLTDEEYARKLQAELELENDARKLQAEFEQERVARRLQEESEQETLARKLQADLEQGIDDVVVVSGATGDDDVINLTDNISNNVRGTVSGEVIDLVGKNDDTVREQQRRELDKLQRKKQNLVNDEQFALQLQNLEENDVTRSPIKVPDQSTVPSSPASFKRHVAQQRAAKEQQLAQLQQYRKLQMEKYNHDHTIATPVMDSHRLAASTGTIDLTDMLNEPYTMTEQPGYSRNHLSPDRQVFSHTQPTTDHIFTQSQTSMGSHLTQTDQSQPSTSGQSQRSNITCGNCGEKGHNRKFVQCPRYHSAEETARREEKAREDKKKKEEKAVQEMILKQINAEKDEKKKQEIRNMQQIVLSAETEFQTTMNRLRNILQEVEHLSEPEMALQNKGKKNARKKKK